MRVLVIAEGDGGGGPLVRELRLDGDEVWCATDGTRGLALAQTEQPDAIVLVDSSGDAIRVELCRALHGTSPRSVIVVLTSSIDSRTRIDALNAGAIDCLSVPYNLQELKARLRALLRRRAWREDENESAQGGRS